MELKQDSIFLMANLGSEVARFFHWEEKGDKEAALNSFKRAEKIVTELVSLPRMKVAKKEPELILKILKDKIENKNQFQVSPESLELYFLPFATAIMK